MVSEVGSDGAWLRAFDAPHMDKFDAPTVEGVDFPALGVSQAWNDTASGTLYVTTYPTTPDRRGNDTSWRVTNLPNPDDVYVLCNGEPFERVEVEGTNTVRLDTTMDDRQYQIYTGYRGEASAANDARNRRRDRAAAAGVTGGAVAQRSQSGTAPQVRNATSEVVRSGGPTCAGCC